MKDYRSKGMRARSGAGSKGSQCGRDTSRATQAIEQLKRALAAEIVAALDRKGLSVRDACEATGIAAADFSRIRNTRLGRFTIDRLVSIASKLGSHVDLSIRATYKRRVPGAHEPVLRPR
jgi:predicted XRE-type DNA-binding protein